MVGQVFALDNIEKHMVSTASLSSRMINIEKSADEWSKLFISPKFLYDKSDRYVFIPKTTSADWDLITHIFGCTQFDLVKAATISINVSALPYKHDSSQAGLFTATVLDDKIQSHLRIIP